MRRTRPVREFTRQPQETLGVMEVEEIWNALAGIAAARGTDGVPRNQPLHDGPFEEAMQHPEEMVVTPWPGAWSGLEEVFDQDAVDRTPSHRGALTKYPSNSRRAALAGRYLRFKACLYSTKVRIGSTKALWKPATTLIVPPAGDPVFAPEVASRSDGLCAAASVALADLR